MAKISKFIAASALLLCASSSFATYRCEVAGRVTYQQQPCAAGQQARHITTEPVGGWRAPPPRRHYGSTHTPRGQEAWRYRAPAVNAYSSRNGPCPSSLEIHNAAVTASSISLTPYERAREKDKVRQMENCH